MQIQGYLHPGMIAALWFSATGFTTANAGRPSPETDLAAPGAPLYEYALNESLKSLMSQQEQEEFGARNRPPSPGPDFFWCKNCKTYHKKGQPPGSAPQPVIIQSPNAAPGAPQQQASPQQPGTAAARPPSPGADSYWCENCRAYHKKLPAPVQSVAVPQAAPGTPAAAVHGEDVRASSPREGYYYCENCKTYHRQPPAAQQPGASPTAPRTQVTPPAAGELAPSSADDFYYCENCKTYHRRQPLTPLPTNAVHITSGLTNNPYLTPLASPQGTKR